MNYNYLNFNNSTSSVFMFGSYLTEDLQQLYRECPSVEVYNYEDVVEIEPPIQYIKK